MASAESALISLRQTLAKASKVLIGGVVSTLSFLISLLLAPANIPLPGIGPVPSWIGSYITFLVAVLSGWIGWGLLRQSFSLLRMIEFQLEVHPYQIQSALTGSALIGVNIVLTKVLSQMCGMAVQIAFLLLLIKDIPESMAIRIVYLMGSFLLSYPYYAIALSARIRFINAHYWTNPSILLRLYRLAIRRYISDVSRNFYAYAKHRKHSVPSSIDDSEDWFLDTMDRFGRKVGFLWALSLSTFVYNEEDLFEILLRHKLPPPLG